MTVAPLAHFAISSEAALVVPLPVKIWDRHIVCTFFFILKSGFPGPTLGVLLEH
jgi:hypothetical protein